MKNDKPLSDDSQGPAKRDSWTDPDSLSIAEAALPRLDETRQRTVRLVISIPVLTLLIVLGSGIAIYLYLTGATGTGIVAPEVYKEIEAAPLSPEAKGRIGIALAATQDRLEALGVAILLLTTFVSIGAGVVGYILARQIVRPIRDLTQTMDAIAQGDFSTKVAPVNLGEFGQLGSTFNRMVEQLNSLFEERDRQLRESFSGAHLTLDPLGSILQADHAARRILGADAGDVIGRKILDRESLIPLIRLNPRLLAVLSDIMSEALAGHPAGRSVLVRDDEGRGSRFLFSALRLQGDHPDRDQVLLEIRDITGMAGFYEQMQRADRLAAVGTLATGIAHEIRNPLASIRGMVQLLGEGIATPDDAPEYQRRIISEVDRLEKLIAGIMDFAGKENSPAEEVDLNQLLRDSAESARHRTGDPSVQITWDLDPTLPHALLQGERIRQALLNLLVNAYQHCAKTGAGPIRIQSMHLPVNQQRPLILCIANPAEPLDDVQRERIFEPFYTTKAEGTGLGLPISYQTIASNGGMLEVESEGGEILFWVRLPQEMPRQKTASRILRKSRSLQAHEAQPIEDSSTP
jgi:signal transduction histidine kinase